MKPDPIATSLGRVLEAGWKPSEKGRDRTGHGGMKPEPCVLEDGSGRPERPAGTGPVCLRPRGVVSSHWPPGSSGRTATPPFPPSIPELPSCSGLPLPDASFDGRLRPHDSSAISLLFPYHRHKKKSAKKICGFAQHEQWSSRTDGALRPDHPTSCKRSRDPSHAPRAPAPQGQCRG